MRISAAFNSMDCLLINFINPFCSLGDPASFVMGHIIDGQFDGSFFAFGETFHLEPAQRHIGLKTSFHSIIFLSSSVQFNFSRIQRKMAYFNDQQLSMVQVISVKP